MRNSFFKIISGLLVAVFLLCNLNACNRTVPLRNPSFEVQSKGPSQVQTAIKKALQNRRWVLLSEQPGVINARYSRGAKHQATIRIRYDKSKVDVTLVDSQNLQQGSGEGGAVIHKTYDNWIRNLENDIYFELSHL